MQKFHFLSTAIAPSNRYCVHHCVNTVGSRSMPCRFCVENLLRKANNKRWKKRVSSCFRSVAINPRTAIVWVGGWEVPICTPRFPSSATNATRKSRNKPKTYSSKVQCRMFWHFVRECNSFPYPEETWENLHIFDHARAYYVTINISRRCLTTEIQDVGHLNWKLKYIVLISSNQKLLPLASWVLTVAVLDFRQKETSQFLAMEPLKSSYPKMWRCTSESCL